MDRDTSRLSEGTFDVVVIGGGVLGGFLAHEASLRGLRTALLEARDFASGTTSASGKVLHGGLRYLQHLELGLAAEASREQRRIAHLVPELVRSVPFLVPARRGKVREAAMSRLGSWAWRFVRPLLPADDRLPSSDFLDSSDLTRRIGSRRARPFSGAMQFHDYQIRFPERLTVALISDACQRGAVAANYVEVVDLRTSGDRVDGVDAVDRLDGREITVRGRVTVNATGPGGATIARSVDGSLAGTGFAKGVHVLLDLPEPRAAMALPLRGESSGSILGRERRVFLMPWEGKTLVGATYSSHGDEEPWKVRPEPTEVRSFLEDLRREWPELELDRATPLFAYAGLYPIFEAGGSGDDTYSASLRPRIVDHEKKGGPADFVSAVSVKLTGAWKLAEDVLTLVQEKLGTEHRDAPAPSTRTLARATPSPLPSASESLPAGGLDGVPEGDLARMIEAAVEDEMARSLEDVLFRRTCLGHLGRPDDARLERAARIMGRRLEWSPDELEEQMDQVRGGYRAVEGLR